MAPLVIISKHTTASIPRPHILYTVKATLNGQLTTVDRRYSEFVALHDTLKDSFSLPPKRLFATTFLPSAWIDDALITERKAGLELYLTNLIESEEHKDNAHLINFLNPSDNTHVKFNLEDALPSTLSRKTALQIKAQLEDEGTPSKEPEAAATLIAAAYYADWSSDQVPPEGIDYSKFDIIFFAFAMPNSANGLDWDNNGTSILKRLVTSARNSGRGTKIVLSVGGWGGCAYFSAAVSNSSNRQAFSNALVGAVNTYGLDGVDLDWEYPNSPGAGNPYSSADAANFLSLLQTLRSALGSSKIISAAVPHLPWLGSNGKPLTNVSAYAAQMTYVNIMNYDVWGSSSTPGPNAPLGNLCGTSSQPQASAQAAFSQWTAAGFPANKILLGLPLYGYVSHSSRTGLTGSLLPSEEMLILDKSENETHELGVNFLNGAHKRKRPQVSIQDTNLTGWWGQQMAFSDIVSSGALVKKSDGNYGQGGGFTMGWDDCSDTPFLFHTSQQSLVTYDDTYSLADKAQYAKNSGMAGCFTWSLDQDDGYTLQNIIRKNLGK
ncbi:glycoside hydrolase family 18 protein [Pluteus cervinus]|uniref:Glycoside hydrolase family 18 protein n=1 Tax=Pluteus cervinus TaxID=181527 RepID=A0ACD3B1V4_9AGAR|nr:glycoside hydrolase family 18 protein [Pluteus cervinus]